MDITTEVSTEQTNGSFDSVTFLLYMLGTSVGIITLLSLLEKRANACYRGLTRPGMTYPVNLLDHGCDRIGYSMAFGCVASACFSLFSNSLIWSYAPWSRTITILIIVLIYGLLFYPLFACLTTTRVFLGSLLGLGYTALWLYVNIRSLVDPIANVEISVSIALNTPVILCTFGLFLRYGYIFSVNLWKMIKSRSLKAGIKQHELDHLGTRSNIAHVRELLVPGCGDNKGPDVDITNLNRKDKLRALVRRCVYRNDPVFKYSPRIICIFTVALICAYEFGVLTINEVFQFRQILRNLAIQHGLANIIDNTQFRLFIDVFEGTSMVSIVIASLFTLYSTCQILTNYRRTVKQMYKGVFRDMPFKRDDKSPNVILSNSLYYSGSQIAYLFWAYIISFSVLFISGLVLMYCVILPIFDAVPEIFSFFWINFAPPFLILLLFRIVQRVSCHVFLQKTETVNKRGERVLKGVLALNNRKAYHNLSYFLFFFYIVLGLFGCMLTIIKSLVLSMFFLARKDRCGLVSGFETWDTGFLNYVSFLYLEECHRHPVLLVFCDLLMDSVRKQRSVPLQTTAASESCDVSLGESPSDLVVSGDIEVDRDYIPRHRLLSRNRWFKAYTLIKNPELIEKDVGEDYDRCSDARADIEQITIHESV